MRCKIRRSHPRVGHSRVWPNQPFGIFLNQEPGYQIEWGVAVGNASAEPERQLSALRFLHRYNPHTVRELDHLVSELQDDTLVDLSRQGSLLDDTADQGVFLIEGRVRVVEAAARTYAQQRRVLKGALGLKNVFQHLGRELDFGAIADQADNVEAASYMLRKLASRKGSVSDALNHCARQYLTGDLPLRQAEGQFTGFMEQECERIFYATTAVTDEQDAAPPPRNEQLRSAPDLISQSHALL